MEMSHQINRKLISRLFLAWILLSILIGSVVFLMETRKIGDVVLLCDL